jgi:hypothetical protein
MWTRDNINVGMLTSSNASAIWTSDVVALHVGCAPFGATTPERQLEHVSEIHDGG